MLLRQQFEISYRKPKKTGIPALYVYGNHEGICLFKTQGYTKGFYPNYVGLMGDVPDFQVQDFGDFLMVAIDNSDHNIRQEQLDKLKEQFAKEIPIILLMHIPLTTEVIMSDLVAKWGKNPTYLYSYSIPLTKRRHSTKINKKLITS